jgi:hypothetical protein
MMSRHDVRVVVVLCAMTVGLYYKKRLPARFICHPGHYESEGDARCCRAETRLLTCM